MASCHFHVDGIGANRRVVVTLEYPQGKPPNRFIADDEEYVRRRFCVTRKLPAGEGYMCSVCGHRYDYRLRYGMFCMMCGAEVIG